MKKIILPIVLLSGTISSAWSQQVPTISNPPSGGHTSSEFWSRAGNLNNGNNLFGTKWNSPIYTITGNDFNVQSYRMKINGIFSSNINQYPINGYNWNNGLNTTGYVLLGNNKSAIYSDKGAFSLLHLNGRNGTFVQEAGYRPWMHAGITFTDNNDFSFIGLRKVGTSDDFTETVIAWADNQPGTYGPDDVTFRFFGGELGTTSISTDKCG